MSAVGCSQETEQDKVNIIVVNIQKAAEERDVKKIVDSISRAYRDQQGNDYASVKNILVGYFLQYPKISIYMLNSEVSVENNTAKAIFLVILRGKNEPESTSPALFGELGTYDFELKFAKQGAEWKVISAQWNQSSVKKQ